MKTSKIIFSFCLLFLALISSSIRANQITYPALPQNLTPVNDYTNTLSQQELEQLNAKVTNFNQKGQLTLVIVIIKTTETLPIQNYSFNLMNNWGIGDKSKQNGVLLLVAKDDRKYFIATGPGIEGVLPDALLSSIGLRYLQVNFRNEDYYKGISEATEAIMQIADNNIPEELLVTPEETYEDWFDKLILFFIVSVFVVMSVSIILSFFSRPLRKLKNYLYKKSNKQNLKRKINLYQVINILAIIAQFLNSRRGSATFNDFDKDDHRRGRGFGSSGGGNFGGGGSRGGGAGGSW
ncbi:TPM domain-containing protein [Psittacicella gerlachiana]|uniref:TPM domain-containing protein n=1 Tax=Psittacicella gerlachiana TaxID=2028574 RepID=A0A3A1YCD5_9GAMM|nr:TPM domain-containing protein [Psittacicella gerlachiana]RIY34879.1 hypothetical protein CKF59_04590 [Psittacicella gerlachiana]